MCVKCPVLLRTLKQEALGPSDALLDHLLVKRTPIMYKLSGKKIHEYLRYKVVKTGNTVDHNFSRTQNFREFREAISNH